MTKHETTGREILQPTDIAIHAGYTCKDDEPCHKFTPGSQAIEERGLDPSSVEITVADGRLNIRPLDEDSVRTPMVVDPDDWDRTANLIPVRD